MKLKIKTKGGKDGGNGERERGNGSTRRYASLSAPWQSKFRIVFTRNRTLLSHVFFITYKIGINYPYRCLTEMSVLKV